MGLSYGADTARPGPGTPAVSTLSPGCYTIRRAASASANLRGSDSPPAPSPGKVYTPAPEKLFYPPPTIAAQPGLADLPALNPQPIAPGTYALPGANPATPGTLPEEFSNLALPGAVPTAPCAPSS